MLERLGEVIKKATDKIANAIFLDKNLVDTIVRDLQRALIEADVSIPLVKQLSDKIKKSAFDERIKEIEKKEHIIKILHDELVKILGEYKQLKLKKEQNRIILLGLYGTGKCVHEKTKIQLGSGEIVESKKLYERYEEKFKEESLDEGKIIGIEEENLMVPSYNPLTQKIENKKVTHLWKLKKEELLEINIENGNDFSIKVTPEHPFFALRNGQVIKIRADELTYNDFISIPNNIEVDNKSVNLFDQIKDMNLFVYLTPEEAKRYVLKNYKTIKEAHKNLKYKKNYCQFTQDIQEGKIPIEFINKEDFNSLRIKGHGDTRIISIPLIFNSNFAEFIGYVIGDGHIEKRYIEITNEDDEIISRVTDLSKSLFNLAPTIKKDARTKNLYQIRFNSKTLVEIFKIFGLNPGKKGKKLEIPEQIMLSDNEVVRSFIQAYFDCDSYPSKNRRSIELTSESQIMIQQISMLLKRFGILSTISKKIINEISYWRLTIKARYSEAYADKISYRIKRKNDAVNKYKTIGVLQGSGNQDMLPLGRVLQELRLQLGFSIGEIQANAVNSYGIYEKKGFISKENLKRLLEYYKLKQKGFIWNILNDISENKHLEEKYSSNVLNGTIYSLKIENLVTYSNEQLILTEKSRQMLSLINQNEIHINQMFTSLEKIADSNICWLPIKNIAQIKNDSNYVYDLTVEDNHSFIAEGFIVHNTTTIAKLGNYFAKRGKKVALVGLDVHRPAAKEQLKQLAEKNKLNYFIDEEESNAVKTWKKFEKKLKDYNLILIDTAGRHNLDKELVKEIKDLSKEIKPTETILVMPADIGQAAKKQASEFQEAVNISGVIVTRMDSSAKGGGALTACAETKAPVYFITNGEKINDIEEFNPERFLSRLLGMGDLQSLIEKVKSVTDEKKSKKILEEGKLTLDDVVEQVKSMNSLGGFDKIKSMIPGMNNAKIPDEMLGTQQEKIAKWEHIIKSMTSQEKENPEIFDDKKTGNSRMNRVARGAGVNNSEVRSLLKQYKMLNEMIKSSSTFDPEKPMSQKQMMKLAKKFGKRKMMKFGGK